jgi:2-polyprenyl-3-methyl-5-hydroxy-6-metoxy-1,4-benzoquinol methylase
MAADERAIWNARYAEKSHASLVPDPFLVDAFDNYVTPMLGDRRGGIALDVAGGVGRHAIRLAKRGWKVTLLDISNEAIAIAKRNAEEARVELDLRTQSATDFFADPKLPQWDLIIVFFFLERELFPALIQQLKPGGLLIYKTYTLELPKLRPGKGPTHPMHLLKRNELLLAFSSLEVLFHRETVKDSGIAELVARKTP